MTLSATPSIAQPHQAWATGDAFHRRLRSSVHIHWMDAPIRDALGRLSATQRVAIVLDRRIDPGRHTTATCDDERFDEALRQIVTENGWGLSILPDVLYVGPPTTTHELATWHAIQRRKIKALPVRHRSRWQKTRTASWPQLSVPQEMINGWIRESRISMQGADLIDYDLWPSQSLPPLDLLTRLTITLAGFGLAARIEDGGRVEIVSLPESLSISQRLTLPRQRIADVSIWRARLPNAQLILRGQVLELHGRIEDIRQVQSWLEPTKSVSPRRAGLAKTRFTLTVKNQPIGAILKAVAGQLKLDLEWQGGTSTLQQQRVSFAVKDATLEQLIATVLADNPATYRVQEGRLIILKVARTH